MRISTFFECIQSVSVIEEILSKDRVNPIINSFAESDYGRDRIGLGDRKAV